MRLAFLLSLLSSVQSLNSTLIAVSSTTTSGNGPPYPITSQQSSGGTAGSVIAPTGANASANWTAVKTVASQLTGTRILLSMPLPSLATIITGTAGSQVVTETFVPHIFPQYSTISGTITTTTTLTAGASPCTVVVGPGGVGWMPYRQASGAPELLPPFVLPPSAVAALDSEQSTSDGDRSASVPLGTGDSSRSLPSGVGLNASSSSSTQSSSRSPVSVGVTSSSVFHGTDISASGVSSSRSSLGNESTRSSVSSSSPGTSGSLGKTTQSASITSTAALALSSYPDIYPISYVTTAFNNPSQSITTLSVSGAAAIVYNKKTLPGLSTITAPTTIKSSVVETDKAGKMSTFIGGIVVGPGGVYWDPPGLPPIPPFPHISPPCVWPFCTGGGGGGGGGSDPPGDPDGNDRRTQDPSNKSEQSSSTPGSSTSSKWSPSSQSSVSSSLSSSSSRSCSSSTVTDYWVSCASDASSACSTYSSSLVSGCSVSAVTTTTTSACSLGAQVSADPTFAEFDYANEEYPVLRLGYSHTVQWTYTVAEIAASGVVVGGAAGASSGSTSSTNTSQSASPITSPSMSFATSPGSGASTTFSATATTNRPSSMSGRTSGGTTKLPSATGKPLCVPFADPDSGVANVCQCSSGTSFATLSMLTRSSDYCGYTSFPSPSPTPPPSSNTNPYPFTYTDLISGPFVGCKSFSLGTPAVLSILSAKEIVQPLALFLRFMTTTHLQLQLLPRHLVSLPQRLHLH